MTKDLNIINQLEKDIGLKLKQLNLADIASANGYAVDENKNVIGLNLFSVKGMLEYYFLRRLINLTHLYLSENEISDISFIKYLVNLTELYLRGNHISDISPLTELRKLVKLDLGGNRISEISVLKELKDLSKLYLWGNQISNIFYLKFLRNLTELHLRRCQITDICFLKNLKSLIKLDLEGNRISDISPLKELKNLTKLDLGGNQISDISILKELRKLNRLYLDKNRISNISVLEGLKQLTRLDLEGNKIADISFLKTLKNLTDLDLRKNKIIQIPVEIIENGMEIKWKNDYKGGIILEGNPIEKPPIEILEKGKEAVKTYFKSLEGKSRYLNEVKMLLVGDGGVGKTSVVKQLLKKNFNMHESPTHGINIKHLEVKSGKDNIKVHIWDFGGQEIMYATHQFFLSKRSLYVLVLDSRRDEKIEYWLKNIESFGGNSPVLVVINKIDEIPGFDVNRKFLQEKYQSIRGFNRISCRTGDGINSFKKQLINQLTKIEHLKTIWSNNWFNVKTQLENMTNNYFSYEQYEDICENNKITDDESRETLLEFLNDLGIVLNFKDPVLREINVINPRWATEAVYKIINSKELANKKGILAKNLLMKILDREKYPPRRHDFIIELMKKFELCFFLDKDTILVPDLLEVGEPEFEFDYDTSLKFVIQYDFLPKSIMPTFIVRMRKDIKDDLRWRTGVLLEETAYDSSALVKADEREQKIFFFVQGKQKRDYFSVVRKILRDINDDFEKLKYTEWVPLPDNNEILIEYDELIGLENLGEEFIIIGKLGKKYPVNLLLDGLEDEHFRKLTSRPIDSDEYFEWDVFISYSSRDQLIVEVIINDLKKIGIRYWWDKDQILPGDSITEKIAEGLRKSRYVMPCFSCNQIKSGWCRAEYTAILTKMISRETRQKVVPLILDDLKHEDIPILMGDYKYERYSDKSGYEKVLQILGKS